MKRVLGIVIVALVAACGGDDGNANGNGGNGGSGGSGGTGGTGGGAAGATGPVVVANAAGRSFAATEAMTVTVEQQVGVSTIPFVMLEFRAEEFMPGGEDTLGYYEMTLRTSGQMLGTGEVVSTALKDEFPTDPGRGKVEVRFTEGGAVLGAGLDTITLQLNRGRFSGTVTATDAEVEATIDGVYEMTCSVLEGTTLRADPNFESDFCQAFAHQLPAD